MDTLKKLYEFRDYLKKELSEKVNVAPTSSLVKDGVTITSDEIDSLITAIKQTEQLIEIFE